MIRRWARWLPYGIVLWLVRNTNASFGKLGMGGTEHNVRCFQVDRGEYIVFSEDIYKKYIVQVREKHEEKENRKLNKINKMLNGDFELRKALEEQVKSDIARRQEESVCED